MLIAVNREASRARDPSKLFPPSCNLTENMAHIPPIRGTSQARLLHPGDSLLGSHRADPRPQIVPGELLLVWEVENWWFNPKLCPLTFNPSPDLQEHSAGSPDSCHVPLVAPERTFTTMFSSSGRKSLQGLLPSCTNCWGRGQLIAKAWWLNPGLTGCRTDMQQAQAKRRKRNRPRLYIVTLGTHLFLPPLCFPPSASTCHLFLSTGASHQSINTEALPLCWLHGELREPVLLAQADLTHLSTPPPAPVGAIGPSAVSSPPQLKAVKGQKWRELLCSAFVTDTEKMRVLFKVPVEHFIK